MATTEPRWRRNPEERPRQILEAAIEVFGEAGLAGARLEEIAQRAGISKGTVYLYFASKDDLFAEVVRDTFAEIVEAVRNQGESDSAIADLRAFCGAYWKFLRSRRFETVYRLVIAELHTFPDLSREYADEVRIPMKKAVTRILERGESTGEIRAGDQAVRARMLLALMWQHGIWFARRDKDLEPRAEAVVFDEVLSFFLDAAASER
ncbi:MAG TPA: TetR/AcrR family transcriptional regulator [Longimicrobiales bacterium]